MTIAQVAAVLAAHERTGGECACRGWKWDGGGWTLKTLPELVRAHQFHVARMIMVIPRGRRYAKPRAECSECGQECALRADGTVQAHHGNRAHRCPGSHQPPKEETP